MKRLFFCKRPALFILLILLPCAPLGAEAPSQSTKSIIRKINSNYYSLIDQDVEEITFNFKLLDQEDSLEGMDIFITCFPARHVINVRVENKPFFGDEELDKYVTGFIAAAEAVAKEFLTAWKRYVTKLIDPRFNQVKSLTSENGEIVVGLVDRGSAEYRLVFDSEYRLKFWEAIELFADEHHYREVPQFELHDSKYLVQTVRAGDFGIFEIGYQEVGGTQLPEKVTFYSERPGLSDSTMFFTDARVRRNPR